MLVSHNKKFIYTKTVKTGGTSVESYFERFCMPDGEWNLKEQRDEYTSENGIVGFRGAVRPPDNIYWHHMPANQIKKQLGSEIWDEYYKFCVVRNPYEKVVSAFYFLNQSKLKMKKSPNLDRDRQELEIWLSENPKLPIFDRNKYTIGGEVCMDDFIHFENLASDLEKVCSKLNVEWDASRLQNFKSGIRPKSTQPKLLFTDKSKSMVEKLFEFEFEYFGYELLR